MPTYTKVLLSQSVYGTPIFVADTGTPGTLIHTTALSTSVIDEVWLYACNTSTSPVLLTICLGGDSSQFFKQITMAPQSGDVLVVAGLTFTGTGGGSTSIRAFASTANQINISGYANRIS